MLGELKVGAVTPMKSMTIIHGDKISGEVALTYKKPKGKRYVFLLLGTENEDGSEPLDCFAVMDKLGWKQK